MSLNIKLQPFNYDQNQNTNKEIETNKKSNNLSYLWLNDCNKIEYCNEFLN